MKQSVFVILSCLFLITGRNTYCQQQIPKTITVDSNIRGYYEYLPRGYSESSAETYPLIVFLHGLGELGNGSSDLPKVLRNGLPRLLEDGTFPAAFTVKGKTFRFIILSPQFMRWPVPQNVKDFFDYALEHYPIDTTRIYLTGLSMGGGATWDFAGSNPAAASMLAAIVPVCGASKPDSAKAAVMAAAGLPVWATHNQGDHVVPVSNTDGYIDYINRAVHIDANLPVKTIFPVNSHNAWTATYDLLFKENGWNIYEWMLQHTRR